RSVPSASRSLRRRSPAAPAAPARRAGIAREASKFQPLKVIPASPVPEEQMSKRATAAAVKNPAPDLEVADAAEGTEPRDPPSAEIDLVEDFELSAESVPAELADKAATPKPRDKEIEEAGG